MKRRTFIITAAQAGLVAVITSRLDPLFAKSSANANPLALNEVRIPPVITGGDMAIASTKYKIFSDADTNVISINNTFPAPTIKLKKGDTFTAKIKNNLSEPAVIHWHGIHAPANMDGHPSNAIAPGATFDVSYPITQRAGTYFYHSHTDMNTARQAYMGMVGLFLISDDEEAALKLPSGQYDVPLLIQDKRFDANKQLVYTPTMEDMATGWLGDQILINGTPNAYLNVAPTVYRLRLINGSNARIYNIAFEGISPTNTFTVIGNDGGLLDKSFSATAIKLAPAERLDILIDLSANKQSDVITMKSLTFSDTSAPGSGTLPQGAPVDLLELHLTKSGSSGFGGLPPVLSQITPYKVANVVTTRPFEFVGHNYINFNSFNMTRIDEHVPLGDLEQWTFINQSDVVHPVHVHGTQFQVLDRGTDNLPEPAEAGWKDVVRLDPFQRMNVLVHFTDYTGIYLIHCHNLEHEDMGMMSNFQVEGPNAVKDEHAETAGIRISPNPATDHATLNFPPLQKDEVLAVTDEKGNLLLKKILAQGSETYFFMMNDLPSGSYLLELGRYKGRMIVMK